MRVTFHRWANPAGELGARHMAELSDWELWAIAVKFANDFGEDAAIQAAIKADAMYEKNDIDGYNTWLAVIARIKRLDSKADAAVH